MTMGISLERRNEIKKLVDEEVNNLRLDVSPERANEVAIIFEHTEKFDNDEIQYMYDYLKEKNIFKDILVLPSNGFISTMSLDELNLWYKHIGKFLSDELK